MLEAGTVRKKNVTEIIVKNITDVNISTIAWWAFGFAIAFVPSGNAFAGGNGAEGMFLINVEAYGGYSSWFFQWCFVSAAASIVSGAVAERCRMTCYTGYAFLMAAAVYPVCVYWVWSSSGWLSPFNADSSTRIGNGLIDFSGSGVVHMSGGLTSLIGAWFVGPRKGRFVLSEDNVVKVIEYTNNSQSIRSIGVFSLWFGWYFFNSGTVFSLDKSLAGLPGIAARVAVNTTLSACACSLSSMVLVLLLKNRKGGVHGANTADLASVTNGVLAGLVSITASSSVVESWAAIVIGALGSIVWMVTSKLLISLQIDDAVDAVPVHLSCGIWGLIAAAIFANESLVEDMYGFTDSRGLIYGGDGMYLATALLFIVCNICWNSVVMLPFFYLCQKMGLLRYTDKEIEDMLDHKRHGDMPHIHAMRSLDEKGQWRGAGAAQMYGLNVDREEGAPMVHGSSRISDDSSALTNNASTVLGGVEMLISGDISAIELGEDRATKEADRNPFSNGMVHRRSVTPLPRVNRIDIQLLETYCSKSDAILDKATLVAMAIQSNAPLDVMNAVKIFDNIAGGSGVISGAALADFCKMMRKSSKADIL